MPSSGHTSAEGLTLRLRVRGVVQGVGFRPFVYRLAQSLGLSGWVLNDPEGVLIEASGPEERLQAFQEALVRQAPAAARVEGVEVVAREVGGKEGTFVIRESAAQGLPITLISPDLAVCEECLRELFDPADPRYLYPYINCTHCGPRYSILLDLPYDRPRTTMRDFSLCPRCQAQYEDPLDRRFHAQPVACPQCGPHYALLDGEGQPVAEREEAIALAARWLREGRILAVKGIGGYHLACDAQNPEAVARLRARKYRKDKPFALMAKDLEALEGYALLPPEAQTLLTSPARPIVLLERGPKTLPPEVAPGVPEIGVMLPYTPLHHLLFWAGAPPLLVMTSGNRSSEPIAYRDEEALERLQGLAEGFLVGERPIARRVDDSVVALLEGRPAMVRRARGYAPSPVVRHPRFQKPILALGAGLKNAIALATEGYVFVSQHIGDLDNLDAFQAFVETLHDLTRMYRVPLEEALVVHDLHPDYPSSRYAEALPGPKLAVQHHRAHIAAVVAEHGLWEEPVLGFAFDGTGLGEDGTVWGGEVFAGPLWALQRVGHLDTALLPGGEAAARYPEQAAVGFLIGQEEALWRPFLGEKPVAVALSLLKSGARTPKTSSLGRLFDAAAALCGFRGRMSYEGQAAIWLEALARQGRGEEAYPFPFREGRWDYRPLLMALLQDLRRGEPREEVARRFHLGLAQGVVEAALTLGRSLGFKTVALSGGVWHNKLLHARVVQALRREGFQVFWNQEVPVGDGGIALGQAALGQMALEGLG
ncbi:carbamoyltransferase HypF [Thermus igniterrae]|uniref:carbamoyltransferase HypF n=1 Tax=Thermus igniterrae TaxID=88189 RepID=UPI0003757353|nr:carbamoyltransferase HypF [Thermus igniterrae]